MKINKTIFLIWSKLRSLLYLYKISFENRYRIVFFVSGKKMEINETNPYLLMFHIENIPDIIETPVINACFIKFLFSIFFFVFSCLFNNWFSEVDSRS